MFVFVHMTPIFQVLLMHSRKIQRTWRAGRRVVYQTGDVERWRRMAWCRMRSTMSSSDEPATDAQAADDGAEPVRGSEWRSRCTEMMSLCRRTRRHVRCSTQQRRVLVGVPLTVLAASAFVAVTCSLRSSTASSHFNAPLFTVNVATLPTIFLYPLYIAYGYLVQHGKLSIRDAFRYFFPLPGVDRHLLIYLSGSRHYSILQPIKEQKNKMDRLDRLNANTIQNCRYSYDLRLLLIASFLELGYDVTTLSNSMDCVQRECPGVRRSRRYLHRDCVPDGGC